MDTNALSRRRLVQLGLLTVVAVPLAAVTQSASAASNLRLRKALNYQATPEDGQKCANCRTFVRGKTPTAPGSCTSIPGDTEISPNGYCMAFAVKA